MNKTSPLSKALLFFGISAALFFLLASKAGAWFDAEFDYRKKITINTTGITEDLALFPVLVRLSSQNFDYSKAKSDGSDIRFVGSGDQGILSYSVEKWDSSGESLIWVRVPSLSASNQTNNFIYLYYGNANAANAEKKQAVFDTDTVLALHFDNESSILDSSTYIHSGSLKNGALRGDGRVGYGLSLDGVNDYGEIASTDAFDFSSGFTVESWVKGGVRANGSHSGVISKDGIFAVRHAEVYPTDKSATFYYETTASRAGGSCATDFTDNEWHHIAVAISYSSATGKINGTCFKDGALALSFEKDSPALAEKNNAAIMIGRTFGSDFLEGTLDELRLSKVKRSSSFIKLSYESVSNASFLTFGTEEVDPSNTTTPPPSTDVPTIPTDDGSDITGGNDDDTVIEAEEPLVMTIPLTLGPKDFKLPLPSWSDYTYPNLLADASEGAYMGWLDKPEISAISGTVNLPGTLDPGTYYFFINRRAYTSNLKMTLSVGGVTVDVPTLPWTWSPAIPVTTTAPANSMEIKITRTNSEFIGSKILISTFYITQDSTVSILSGNQVGNPNFPTTVDTSVPKKGNMIENASFESGVGHGWGYVESREVLGSPVTDEANAYDGKSSLKVTFGPDSVYRGYGIALASKFIKTTPNKEHTLSFYVKAPAGKTATGIVKLRNPYNPKTGFPAKAEFARSFTANDTWQRYSMTQVLPEYITSEYQIIFEISGNQTDTVYIDAVQLEEGALSDFSLKEKTSIGITFSEPGNVFTENEQAIASFKIFNGSGLISRPSIRYEVFDYLNRVVKSGSIRPIIGPKDVSVSKIDLSTGKKGIFRVHAWAADQNGTDEEVVFSVLPEPVTTGQDPASVMGVHPDFTDNYLRILQKAGFKWLRVMSPATFFRWSYIENPEGTYVWYDKEIDLALSYGFSIMGTIGTNNYWPAWADETGPDGKHRPNLDKWSIFVKDIATHYKGKIAAWEIWNEPGTVPIDAAHYAAMLDRAASAIRSVDPDVKIIGIGGEAVPYMDAVISNLLPGWQDRIDALATHQYPPNGYASDYFDKYETNYNMEVWNTETGFWDQGFYQGSNSKFYVIGDPIYPASQSRRYYDGSQVGAREVAINFLESIGGGLDRYFYYDARLFTSPLNFGSHPTIFEYDDTLRSKGVALSALSKIFGHTKGKDKIPFQSAGINGYLYERNDGTPLAALWVTDGKNKKISTLLNGDNYIVYDVFGNVSVPKTGEIAVGRVPVYIEGTNISLDSLKIALSGGLVSLVQDKSAPNISIPEGPRGDTKSSLRIRYVAFDNQDIPSLAESRAVTYSYRLTPRDSAWTAWTPKTYVDFKDLAPGSYIFEVRAKDASGNVSEIVSRPFRVGSPVSFSGGFSLANLVKQIGRTLLPFLSWK